MKPAHQDIAIKFLKHFCQGNTKALAELLHDDFRFSGPFIAFDSKEGYLNSLAEEPPKDYAIEILKSFEDGADVGLFYNFSRPGLLTSMAQYFKFKDGKITESLLIFDTRIFNQKS